MYDNIKTILYINTLQNFDNEVFTKIKERFSMHNENRMKGTCNNAGAVTLLQNKGIFIAYTPTKQNCPEHFKIELSLHKFYNAEIEKSLQNYNNFSFSDAKFAFTIMVDFLIKEVGVCFDITKAEVKTYEIGLNIQLPAPPENYMKELSHVQIGQRELRILETNKYSPYKHFSTHSYAKIRNVYSFYDKTKEVLSKNKDANVPNNLLRVEKDFKRQSETKKDTIYFNDKDKNGLFNQHFINAAYYDFAESFTRNLRFKETAVKDKNMTCKDIIIHDLLEKFGSVNIYAEIERRYKEGIYTKSFYYRLKLKIDTFLSTNFEVKTRENEKTKYFKSMLLQKTKEFKP